jgi:8-oxo-dGTP pyrophosphatase MutT (NUDIX family)
MEIASQVKDVLDSRTVSRIQDTNASYMHAGVLIPLLDEEGVYKVLFTERTHKVEHHKGQISFPGGRVDDGDASAREAALREAHEEIGVKNGDVEILGRIDDTFTLVSNFVVHPFVGIVPYPYDFTLNRAEVEKLIVVPLAVFHPESLEYRRDSVEYEGMIYRATAYEYKGDVIWGATARMMENFMDIVGHILPLPRMEK